jgi:hypothetical protein
MLFVDSVLRYDTASLCKQFVVLRRNVMHCSLWGRGGVSREMLLSFEVSRTTYPMTMRHIPEEGDSELYHSNNLKTCIVTF